MGDRRRNAECKRMELTISLILRLHVHERVKVDVAMEVDVGLDAPVPAVLLEELVFEEELLVYPISGQHIRVEMEQ